jgi:hypothetical protein
MSVEQEVSPPPKRHFVARWSLLVHPGRAETAALRCDSTLSVYACLFAAEASGALAGVDGPLPQLSVPADEMLAETWDDFP